MGDADYLYAFQQVVMPVAYDFDPDLVISELSWHNEIGLTKMRPVAAGFDAAIGDQLGGCFVTPTCYAHMTHMLSPLAGGKLVVCLEVSQSLILKRLNILTSEQGRLQPRVDLKVCVGRHPNTTWRATRSHTLYQTDQIGLCDGRYGAGLPIPLLAVPSIRIQE